MLDGKFLGGDNTLGLVADIEQDLVAVDLDYGSFNDVTTLKYLMVSSTAAISSSSVPISKA